MLIHTDQNSDIYKYLNIFIAKTQPLLKPTLALPHLTTKTLGNTIVQTILTGF